MEVIEATASERPARRKWGQRKTERAAAPSARAFDLAPPQWVAALLAGAGSLSTTPGPERSEGPDPYSHRAGGDPGLRSAQDPAWGRSTDADSRAAPLSVRALHSERFSLVSACVAGAGDLDDDAFERSCAGAYRALSESVRGSAAPHPLRFWNHIPAIRNTKQPGLDRYMVFNAGRYAACSEWFGSPDAFDRLLPTASAVGHGGADLVVHVLCGTAPGSAIENPRQVPSYHYSRRFGPRPPCFARATALRETADGHATILVGGTASIRGEDTAHPGDLRAQTLETFENLHALVRAAGAGGLKSFETLRVYYVHPADRDAITQAVAAAFPHLGDVEYVRADLCRPDLMVEIEGVARAGGM